MPIAIAVSTSALPVAPAAVLRRGLLGAALITSLCAAPLAYSADPATAPAPGTHATPATQAFLLTIFLRHDESKPLPKINDQLRAQGFFKTFPPPGIEVVSWYVMMGIGQVVTLRVPASRLREVNRAIETTAWGGYRTEFYPTYDYKAQAQQMRATDGK
jgi:hypothetical protein